MPPSCPLTRRTALGLLPAVATVALITASTSAKASPLIHATGAESLAAWEAFKATRLPHNEYMQRIETPLSYIRHLHWLSRRDEDFTVMLVAVPTEPDERDRRAAIKDRWLSTYVRALQAGRQP